MFTTAFDASGHEKDQLSLVVAGFISSAKDWAIFDQEWKDRLAEDGLQSFHMVEFAQSSGAFKEGWRQDEKRRQELLSDLISIIRRNSYRKFGVAIINQTFQGNVPDDIKRDFRLNAYSLAGRTCVADVSKWATGEKISTPIQHIFEDGDIGRGKLIERMNRDGYPTPDFRQKRDSFTPEGLPVPAFTPLQAADILAYELFKVVKTVETSGPVSRFRWAMNEFMDMQGYLGIYQAGDLGEMSMMFRISREVEIMAKRIGIPESGRNVI